MSELDKIRDQVRHLEGRKTFEHEALAIRHSLHNIRGALQ